MDVATLAAQDQALIATLTPSTSPAPVGALGLWRSTFYPQLGTFWVTQDQVSTLNGIENNLGNLGTPVPNQAVTIVVPPGIWQRVEQRKGPKDRRVSA